MPLILRALYELPRPLVHRPTRGRTHKTHLESLSRPLAPPMGLEMGALGSISADVRHKAAPPAPAPRPAHRP